MAGETVKISANLPKDTLEQLRWIASQRGTTMSEVLRRAVEHEAFFFDQISKGGKVLHEDASGTIRQVVIR